MKLTISIFIISLLATVKSLAQPLETVNPSDAGYTRISTEQFYSNFVTSKDFFLFNKDLVLSTGKFAAAFNKDLTLRVSTPQNSFDALNINHLNGNVGIGTASPDKKLTVAGDVNIGGANNGSLRVRHIDGKSNISSNYGALFLNYSTPSPVYIGRDDNQSNLFVHGNVGIGTSNPAAKLHVFNGNNSYGTILANADEANFSLYAKTLTTQPANVESFRLGLKYASDEDNGFISFYRGPDTSGGYLGFSTDGVERLKINSNGNVGIGTANPTQKLEVNGDVTVGNRTRAGSFINIIGAGAHQEFGLRLGGVTNPDARASILSSTTSGGLSFSVLENLAMRINSAGNVGIGTANPTRKLEVTTADSWNQPPLRIGSIDGNEPAVDFRSGTGAFGISVNNGTSNAFKIYHTATENSLVLGNIGNVGIGTSSPTYKLEVNGTIRSKEIKVEASPWPDYVFTNDYELKPLSEVQEFIESNGHLPNIPSAAKVETDGIELGMMNAKLLEKIEELTLYTIEQENKLDHQESKLTTQNQLIQSLVQRLEKLENK